MGVIFSGVGVVAVDIEMKQIERGGDGQLVISILRNRGGVVFRVFSSCRI